MNNESSIFKAAVGMSSKWDAKEAGREVAKNTLDRLGEKPSFLLLLSSIHYKENGGFKEFLKGVWEILPEGTPLVGGTVTGFINPEGCYIRGATALAVSYPNMDVSIGYGTGTKRNPDKAAEECINMIRNGLERSEHKNKFVFDFVSGSTVLNIPGYGNRKVVDSEFIGKSVTKLFGLTQILLQKGLGREDEIFEEIAKKLPDCNMILGSSMDDYRGLFNYQFFNSKVLTNSVVGLGIATDLDIDVNTNHGMRRTGIKMKITKLSKDGHIIQEINGKPAVPEIYRLLNWPKNFLKEETLFQKLLYYPLSLKKSGREVPAVMAIILGDYIVTPCKVEEGDVWILTVSGKSLLKAMKSNLEVFNEMRPEFGLFSVCITILETLGSNVCKLRENIIEYLEDKPFILFFSTGEGTYSPTKGFAYANMSYNTAIFGHKK